MYMPVKCDIVRHALALYMRDSSVVMNIIKMVKISRVTQNTLPDQQKTASAGPLKNFQG